MGCCGGINPDPEIQNAKSIEELAKIFKDRKNKFSSERKQTNDYIKDKNTDVEGIDVKGVSDDQLRFRIEYLNDLENAYGKVTSILTTNKDYLPLDEIKPYLQNIASKYFYTFDPNKELDFEMNKFIEYVDSWKKKNPTKTSQFQNINVNVNSTQNQNQNRTQYQNYNHTKNQSNNRFQNPNYTSGRGNNFP